ncbi:MAG: hypothetical protein DMF72_01845 [Acidobacteria bacterium]|nr:MAG: hypothetical protein DMF72_01845 [Acidobacteriota bacterium]
MLACLAFGSTAEFTHHHGNQSQGQPQASSSIDRSLVTRLEADKGNGGSSTSKSQTDCLICQLHQNLSTTELSQPSALSATEARICHPFTITAVHLFEFADTQRGRAPPILL